jgi:prophage tail gpP-like protein
MIDIVVDGKRIYPVEISTFESIEAAAKSFSFKTSEGIVHQGSKVEIFVNNEIVISGKIELTSTIMSSNLFETTYMGRSNSCNFIDSDFDKTLEFNRSLNIQKIISDIAAPFGLSVNSDIEVRNFSTGELPVAYAGQNIFKFCDKLCRIRGVILTSSSDGNLLITKGGIEKNNTAIIVTSDYSNVFERFYTTDNTKRYDKYTVFSQNNSTLDNLNNLVNTKSILGAGVRNKTIIENNSLSVGECRSRAEFERDLDIRNASKYSFKMDGIQSFKIGQIVSVKDDFALIDSEMIVNSVKYFYNSIELYTDVILEQKP